MPALPPISVALLAAAVVAAAADWVAVAGERRALERASKPLVIVLLIGVALTLEPSSAAQRGWFVAALLLSVTGDVLLLGGERGFVAGLAAFLVAHLAYIRGLAETAGSGDSLAAGIVFVALAAVFAGLPIVRGAARRGAVLAVAVAAYVAVISVTVVVAGLTDQALARAGAVALYASDGVLGWNRFVHPVPRGRLVTRLLYHAGQVLLVLSLAG